MPDSDDDNSGIMTGFLLGALVGAGMSFMFGTKKGKELREAVREEYPEFFDLLGKSPSDITPPHVEPVKRLSQAPKPVPLPKKRRFFRSKKSV